MSNINRERSDYLYELTAEQKKRLLEIALKKDRSLEEMIIEAIDRYIEHEL